MKEFFISLVVLVAFAGAYIILLEMVYRIIRLGSLLKRKFSKKEGDSK